jgi:large subunit ribosomal protein L31
MNHYKSQIFSTLILFKNRYRTPFYTSVNRLISAYFQKKSFFFELAFLLNKKILPLHLENLKDKKISDMKKDIHPKSYRLVVFKDISTDSAFLTRSTANSKETTVWEDGKEYPLIKMEISSYSHPFFTGKVKFVDTAGRIDKFNKKFAKFAK